MIDTTQIWTETRALPPADPSLIFIITFGNYSYVRDLAIDDIKFRHKTDTSYGLLCWPFKLNGQWTAVVGPMQ